MHLPALYVTHVMPDIRLFNIPQVVKFLAETILSVHIEGFQPNCVVKGK